MIDSFHCMILIFKQQHWMILLKFSINRRKQNQFWCRFHHFSELFDSFRVHEYLVSSFSPMIFHFDFRGKFGEVKKCREKSTQHLLAAKFIQVNKEQDRIEAYNEIEIMKALQHSRLLQLYDAFDFKGAICLILELWVSIFDTKQTHERHFSF